MSKFFFDVGNSSSSDSDDESVEEQRRPKQQFMHESSSDSEEDTRRVIRNKDKRGEELQEEVNKLRNHLRIRDFKKATEDFESLVRVYERGKKQDGEVIPVRFLVGINELEETLNRVWGDADMKGALSKDNTKALTLLRSKVRKHNAVFTDQLADVRAHPEKYAEAAKPGDEKDEAASGRGSQSESEDEPDSKPKPKAKTDGSAPGDTEKQAVPVLVAKKQVVAAKKKDDDLTGSDEDDESDVDDDDDDDDDHSDSSSSLSGTEGYTNLAQKFLKKAVDTDDLREEGKKRKEKKREKQREAARAESETETESDVDHADEPDAAVERGEVRRTAEQRIAFLRERLKLGVERATDLTNAMILKRLGELLAQRGKRSTKSDDQIEVLEELQAVFADAGEERLSPALRIRVLFCLIAALFDVNWNLLTSMKKLTWEKSMRYVALLLDLVMKHSEVNVSERISDDEESYETRPYAVTGCVLSVVERLDEELFKLLQSIDPHSLEYVERLRDEPRVAALIDRVTAYVESRFEKPDILRAHSQTVDELARAYLKKMEHLYWRYDQKWAREHVARLAASTNGPLPTDAQTDSNELPSQYGAAMMSYAEFLRTSEAAREMYRLHTFLVRNELRVDAKLRSRALIMYVHFLALHDQYYAARECFQMSQVAAYVEAITNQIASATSQLGAGGLLDAGSREMQRAAAVRLHDLHIQTTYNRLLIQLGFAAFRHGMIKDAHQSLVEIQSSGKVKELLGQGTQQLRTQQPTRTEEEERLEKLKQLPYYQHVNLELVECIYLISAMLTEIPYLAAHEYDSRKRMISKNFHHVLKQQERQLIQSHPPETIREYVIAASKSLRFGDWRDCVRYLFSEKMSAKIWAPFTMTPAHLAHVRSMLTAKVKAEALRCYLFTYRYYYDSMHLGALEAQFELPKKDIYALLSKMIMHDEINASLDQPTETLTLYQTGSTAEPNRLHSLALQFNEKLQSLFEANEKHSLEKQQQLANLTRAQALRDQIGPHTAGAPSRSHTDAAYYFDVPQPTGGNAQPADREPAPAAYRPPNAWGKPTAVSFASAR